MKKFLDEDKLCLHMRLLQPSRPVLVTTFNEDKTINIAPFSWITPISSEPPMVGLALLARPKAQKSLENIRRNREFVINLPSLELAEKIVKCSFQYKKDINKFQLYNFTPQASMVVEVPGVAECDSSIECRCQSILTTGDHDLIVARVESATYDTDKFDDNLLRNLKKGTPCLHFIQHKQQEGQVHIFAGEIDTFREIFAAYPERDKKR